MTSECCGCKWLLPKLIVREAKALIIRILFVFEMEPHKKCAQLDEIL